MPRQGGDFSARSKSDLVIELPKGEKGPSSLAAENNIQPDLLRNQKEEFFNNASSIFNDRHEENLEDRLTEEYKEKAEYAKKAGQLTIQADWFKRGSEGICGPGYESKFSPKPFGD